MSLVYMFVGLVGLLGLIRYIVHSRSKTPVNVFQGRVFPDVDDPGWTNECSNIISIKTPEGVISVYGSVFEAKADLTFDSQTIEHSYRVNRYFYIIMTRLNEEAKFRCESNRLQALDKLPKSLKWVKY